LNFYNIWYRFRFTDVLMKIAFLCPADVDNRF
jgi:hypothetical protein